MTDAEILRCIQKTHFKEFRHVFKHVKAQFPNVTKQKVKDIIAQRPKDKKVGHQKHLMLNCFASHLNAWMTDLMENQKEYYEARRGPRFWMIFIHINSKFARAYPTDAKSAAALSSILDQFFRDEHGKVSSLTHDEEGGLCSESVRKKCKDKKVNQRIIEEQQHSSLSVIDRFIRTLRDMNQPSEKSKKMSFNTEYRNFSVAKMRKLISLYNKTRHDAHGYTPEEMHGDEKKEVAYIASRMKIKHKIQKQEGWALLPHVWVRILLAKNSRKKRRSRLSRERYEITGKNGNLWICEAENGDSINVPRWRLIIVPPDDYDKVPIAKECMGVNEKDTKRGTIDHIISYDSSTKKYKVLWEGIPPVESFVSVREMRNRNPQVPSLMELAFWRQRRGTPPP